MNFTYDFVDQNGVSVVSTDSPLESLQAVKVLGYVPIGNGYFKKGDSVVVLNTKR